MNVVLILVVVAVLALAGGSALSGVGGSLFSMGKLTPQSIAMYAAAAGFSDADLTIAVAVAMAESSGDPNAVGDGGTSYGLWQIHWTVHPDTYQTDPKELFDPQTNANAAYTVFLQQGWNAWSTYGSGPGHNNAYLAFLGDASAATGYNV